MEGQILKRDDDKFLVFGFASAAKVEDSHGDTIAPEELERAAYDFVLNSRAGGEMHQQTGVATLIESFMITADKAAALGIDEKFIGQWWVGFKVHDAEVWQKIKNGSYAMFSIGGYATRSEGNE